MVQSDKRKRLTSSASHFPVDLKKPEGPDTSKSGNTLKNHQEAAVDLLFDPKDAEGGDTHSDKPVKVKAALTADVDGDEDVDFADIEDAMPPTEGDTTEEASLYAADEGVENSVLDQFDDEDQELDSEVDGEGEEAIEPEVESFGGDMGVDDPAFGEGDEPVADDLEAEQLCGEDGVPLVDVDQTEDAVDDTDDLGFAAIGASLHCIKANRIIATMTKKAAIKAGKDDFYQGDEFPMVVAAEVQSKGLRKGLIAAGFELSKVDVTSSKAVRAAVDKELITAKKKVVASEGKSQEAFQQCMAIAAVGMNRNFFKNSPNELSAGLVEDLSAAGVRNAPRIVRAAFAQHGIDYARSLIAMANKLVAMPEETRNQFAEALDMTEAIGDEGDEVEDEGNDFDPDALDDEIPASVSAAVRTPIRSTRVHASSTQRSAAQEILAGNKPLPFIL